MLKANLPQLTKLIQLSENEEYFDIEKVKTKHRLNLSVQIGYFILQNAKLHMLRLYYAFMDKFVERCNFECCEMDTDSAYMALASSDFVSAIRQELRYTYLKGFRGYCVPDLKFETDGDRIRRGAHIRL